MSGLRFEYPEIELTEEQEEEAERIGDILRAKALANVRYVSRLLASRANGELLGETEFLIRDAVHRLGAAGVDAALHERKQSSIIRAGANRGTKDPASSVPVAERTHDSKGTGTVR